MPELPEVTTISNQLKKEIKDFEVVGVRILGSYRTEPEISVFKKEVKGKEIDDVERVAKTIVIKLKSGSAPSYIVIHLAMTGRLLLRNSDAKADPWTRLVFQLASDKEKLTKELRFCDSRMFGFVKLLSGEQLETHRKKYGPDALDPNLTVRKLLDNLQRKKTAVKRALLEQELIAGVGNIYANDSLWMAGIHPETLTSELTQVQAAVLLGSLREILEESIIHRGSTLGDKMYIDLYGKEGTHQNYFRVFGRDGQPCPRCREKIVFTEIGGRGTFYCPKCQVRGKYENQKHKAQQLSII
jgi:formamidopyrimidine-DNA glycosylase